MVRNIFYSFLRTISYVIAPDLQIAGPVLKRVKEGLKGVLYVDHGWGSIVDQLHDIAVQQNVHIQTGCKILSVQHTHQKVDSLLMADGRTIEASDKILTVPPATMQKMVPHAEQTAIAKWNQQAIPITAACLDVALKRLPNPKHQFIMGIDQPVFLTDQSREGKPRPAQLSENGEHKISLIKYQGQQTNAEQDRKELEQVLDLAQPGWRDELTVQQYLPKITVVYNFPHIQRTTLPGPEVPEIAGLYVAGDWAGHDEMLVDASVASARRAIDRLLQHSHVITA
jgi:phytoene dehydrogenase-like protein